MSRFSFISLIDSAQGKGTYSTGCPQELPDSSSDSAGNADFERTSYLGLGRSILATFGSGRDIKGGKAQASSTCTHEFWWRSRAFLRGSGYTPGIHVSYHIISGRC
jgi:hypothetical protein